MVAPTGTITFLFTDIEGSTVRWDRDRQAMRQALRRHDAIMREAIASRAGHVFKTVGDAFCAAFARAEDAVGAAYDAQQRLAAEDFRAVDGLAVRMALHSGTTDERSGDYFGPPVNRVARLLAIGHGGQVLLSSVTADLAEGALPSQTSLLDLGEHRLKDLTRSERVYQLCSPDLPSQFPPVRSLEFRRNNLPLQLSSFVGRDVEIAEIRELLSAYRLVTLTGAGGVGKTRAALHAAAGLADDYRDGVWFVDLAPVSSAERVAAAVAEAQELMLGSGVDVATNLVRELRSRQALLVLDNCEHLIEGVAALADAVLRSCPSVRLLATSREPLGIGGEEVYPMPALPVPPSTELARESVLAYGAVVLFVERARAADRRFELGATDAPVVAEITRRLDGVPLAIELAAARTKALTIEDLARQLDRALAILTSGNRAALPRQQTMRATIEWSYDLLSDPEKAFFRRLSVFAAGATLDGVVRFAAHEGVDEETAVARLASLVDKSLVQVDTDDGKRYRLLESTREFAADKLIEQGERAAAARAHALAFLTLAEDLDNACSTTSERVWRRQVRPEVENWRAALEWSLGSGEDVLLGQRLLTALQLVPFLTLIERRRFLAMAREAIGEETPLVVVARIDLFEAQVWTLGYRFDSALAAAKRAEAAFSELHDELSVAKAQRYAGYALTRLGSAREGEVSLQAALKTYRERNEDRATAGILHDIGDARNIGGDVAGARSYYDEALQLYQGTGAEDSTIGVLRNLAEAEFLAGDPGTALDLAKKALAFDRETNNRLHIVNDLLNICAYEIASGWFDEATASGLEALTMAHGIGADVFAAIAFQHLAAVGALRDGQDRQRAARLFGYAEGRLAALQFRGGHTEQQEYDAALRALHAEFGAVEVAKLCEEGKHWNDERALAEAHRLPNDQILPREE
ncbi:MAG TPA: adenylate/guanylate cyclase domain-containing protein [Candidatus Cybelea sp.]|nr:adenylate/guanylate cyclase domain-containing protein [Candidatus Cybelea sp.]